MIEEEISSEALDFGYLREAIEGRNPDLLLGFYADDAALRIVNSDAPGGPAFELRGTAQIEKCLRAVCDQEMTCAVEGIEVKRGHISFGERASTRTGRGFWFGRRWSCEEAGSRASSTWWGEYIATKGEHEKASRVGPDGRERKERT
jgi:hypothetical protein